MTSQARGSGARHEDVRVAGRPVERLDSAPGMGGAFARALVPSGRGGSPRIPERVAIIDRQRQDRARLAEYARTCGMTVRDSVPATWIHVLTFPLHVHLLSDRESSVRLVGAVHVSNEMTLLRPVTADEDLELSVHLADLRPHRRGALVDLVGTARAGEEIVWTGVSTYLSQSTHVDGEPAERDRLPFAPAAPHARWRLTADLGRRYRRVSRDPNPIHTSRIAARAFGFPRPIIHGMWTHARALAALEGRLPDAYSARVDFLKPIALPSTVGFRSGAVAGGHSAAVTDRAGTTPHMLMSVTEANAT